MLPFNHYPVVKRPLDLDHVPQDANGDSKFLEISKQSSLS